MTTAHSALIAEARRLARVILRRSFNYVKTGDEKDLGDLWEMFAPLECVRSCHCAEVDHRVVRLLQIRVEIAKANMFMSDLEAYAFDRLWRRVAMTMHLIGDFDPPMEP